MSRILEYLEYEFWASCNVYDVLLAFVVLFVTLIVNRILTRILNKWLDFFLRKTHTEVEEKTREALNKSFNWLVILIGVKYAGIMLNLPGYKPGEEAINVNLFFERVIHCAITVTVMWFLMRVADVFGSFLQRIARKAETVLETHLVPILVKSMKVIIILIGVVTIIHLAGGNVKAIVAGFGIGGLAVALAAQETLKDVFGSIMIFMDRPFKVGDLINTNEVEGFVEEIGFRSTRIRTIPNTLVTIPNSKVADSVVNNYSKMEKRHCSTVVGVTYDTTADQMEEALKGIKRILETHAGVNREIYFVQFSEFGDSSLNIMVDFYTVDTTRQGFYAVREDVFLSIMRLLEKMGIDIAFPSQSLYVEKWPERPGT